MIVAASDLTELARTLSVGRTLRSGPARPLPSREAVIGVINRARRILFPHTDTLDHHAVAHEVESDLTSLSEALGRQIDLALACDADDAPSFPSNGAALARAFVERLPELQALLESDVQAAYNGDPALRGTAEALLCYPGVTAVCCYRLAHALHQLGVPLLPRMITEHAHFMTGIDIHPAATIGKSFFIDHGTGVVIGGTAIIGDRVRLYQGVTLGAKSLSADAQGVVRKGVPRHPIVEDDVVIYSWATILGRITIGAGSVIGGNVWVTRDVDPGSLVTQASVQRTGFTGGAGI